MANTTQAHRNPTAAQLDLLKTMFAERTDVAGIAEMREAHLVEYRAGRLSFEAVSAAITWMKREHPIRRSGNRPEGQQTGPKGGAWTDIPDGYYATASATGNNDLDFWFVSTAGEDEGEWAGFRRVARVIGGRSDQRVGGRTRRAALEAITEAGAFSAGMLYSQKLRRCHHCNLRLTDRESRAAGLGPICRKNEGVEVTAERLDALALRDDDEQYEEAM